MKFKRIPLPMEKVAELEAIYASLPTVKCQRKCAAYCCWPPRSDLEEQRILNSRGRELPELDTNTMACQLLKQGGCSQYQLRPLICRLFGVAEGLLCEHGCEPSSILTREEAFALQDRVLKLDVGLSL